MRAKLIKLLVLTLYQLSIVARRLAFRLEDWGYMIESWSYK